MMRDARKTREQLINELMELRQRIAEMEASETKRERAEEALRVQRDKFEGIIASLANGLDIVSQDYRVHFQNNMLRDRFGDMTGKLCYEGYMARETPCESCPMVKAVATSSTQRMEITGADGREYEITSTPFRDIDGEIKAIEVVRDITERTRAEEALRASVRQWQTTFDAIGDAISLVDLEGRILRCNEAMVELLGKPPGEIIGRACYKLVHGTPEPIAGCPIVRMRETRQRETKIVPIGDRWFRVVVDPLLDEDGNLIGGVHIISDITERKRAREALGRRAAQLALINDIGGKIAAVLELDSVLDRAAHLVQEGFGYHHVALFTLDHERGELVMKARVGAFAHLFPPDHRLKLGQGMVGWVGRHGETLLANDVDAEPRYVNLYPDVVPTWSELSMPIRVGEEIVGVLDVQSPQRNAFDENDVMVMETLTDQIAVAIENARLYEAVQRELAERRRAEEALKRRAEQLATLSQASQAVTASLEFDQVLAEIVSLAGKVVASDYTSVVLVDEAGQLGRSAENVPGVPAIEFRIRDEGLTDWIVCLRQAVVIDEIGEDGAINPDLGAGAPRTANPFIVEAGIKSVAGLPLVVKDRLLGVLYLHSLRPGAFYGQLPLLTAFANQVAIAIENARLHDAAQQELAERKRVLEALRESEERYRRLVEFSPETIAVHSEGKIIYINTAGVKLLGAASPGELVGKPIMDFVHPDSLEIIRKRVRQSHEQGEAAPPTEEKFIRPDGQVIDVETTAVPITYQGKPAMLAVSRDITERKQLEAQLRQAQKMETLGGLAAGIAHDFNNLLTPIGGFAALLLKKAPEGSQQQEYLHYIEVAAERAAALTHQLRLFTRQEEGERHPVQLNSVIEETRDLLKRSISREIAIELRLASELWAVEANPSQISQVLMNLCLNARDAMPEGGTLTLETRNVTLDEEYARAILGARPGRYVCLSVSDTGYGMSPEVQARIFEPFFTTKEAGKGTGLGLAVVYGIVNGHRGFIQVYSQEGRGSTFRIYLPAVESAVEEREVEVSEMPTGTETILLVDDEEMVRALGQRALERCGYTVLTAENGVQALEVYQTQQGVIALVVLDVVMPEMGGRECLRRLRKLDPQVKVLISTGYMAKDLAQELVAEGALGVVEKPFQIRDFVSAMRTTIDGS